MEWEVQPKKVRVLYTKSLNSHLYPEYRRTRETRWEYGGPSSKPKYYSVTDSEEVL